MCQYFCECNDGPYTYYKDRMTALDFYNQKEAEEDDFNVSKHNPQCPICGMHPWRYIIDEENNTLNPQDNC